MTNPYEQFAPAIGNNPYDKFVSSPSAVSPYEQFPNVAPVEPESADHPIRQQFKKNVEQSGILNKDPSLMDYILSGFGSSNWGMFLGGKVPELQLNDNSSTAQRVAFKGAEAFGEAPTAIAGAVLGSEGGPIGSMAGAFALPSALRPIMMDAYNKDGGAKTFKDFWKLTQRALLEEARGYITGAAVGTAGAATGALAAGEAITGNAAIDAALQTNLAKKTALAAQYPALVTTLTEVGSRLNGHAPEWKDYLDNALLLAGPSLAGAMIPKLQNVFIKTGKTPTEVTRDMQSDPSIKEDILAGMDVPKSYETLVSKPNQSDINTGENPPPPPSPVGHLKPLTPENVNAVSTYRVSTDKAPIESLADFGTEKAAADRSVRNVSMNKDIKQTLHEVKLNINKPLIISDVTGGLEKPLDIASEVRRSAGITEEQYSEIRNEPDPVKQKELLVKYIKDGNHDSLAYENKVEDPGSYTFKVLDPSQVTMISSKEIPIGEPHTIAENNPPQEPLTPPSSGDSGSPVDRVLSRISIGEQTQKKSYNFEDAYRDYVDRLFYLNKATKAMSGGKELPMSEDPYILSRKLSAVSGKAAHFIEHGTFDPKTLEETGKSLKEILEPVKDNIDEFKAYAVSKRALELDKRGIKHGISSEDAASVVKQFKDRFEPALKELKTYQDSLIDYLRESGVISRDMVKLMKEANQDYVPFFRVMDEGDISSGTKGILGNPLKKIKGSDRLIIDPLESIIGNTYKFISLADKNNVVRAMVELSEKSPEGPKFVEKIPSSMRPIRLADEEVSKILDRHGIGGNNPPEEFTIFRPNANFLSDNEIALFRDGKREVYKIDPEIAKALKNLNSEPAGLITKILSIPARLLRAGTTLSPEFAMRNLFRDQESALVFGRGYIPFSDALNGFSSLIKKDQSYRDWIKSGGGQATIANIDRDYLQESLDKILTKSPVIGQLKNPLIPLRILSDTMENSTRLGLYKRTLGRATDAESKLQAAFTSREGTLDFSRRGAKMSALNMIDAFLNPTVQGLDRMVRGIKDDPKAFAIKVAAGITIPSVLLYLSNRDDPRYQNLSQWQKDLYWIIPTDHWIDISDNPGKYGGQKSSAPYLFKQQDGKLFYNDGAIIKLPKPQELGLLFGTTAERFAEYVLSQDPKAFDELLLQMGSATTPNIVPNAAAPIIEMYANKNLFTGAPLIPADREGMLPEYQYAHYTSELTKKIGSLVSSVPGFKELPVSSPANIDAFIQAWSGQLGVTAVNMADAALRKIGALPDVVKPASTLADIPIIKAFVVRNPSMGMKPITDFYDKYAENQLYITTIQKLIKEGRGQDALSELRLRETGMFQLGGIKDAMANINKAIRYVEANPNISADEKRQLIDGMYYKINFMAKSGNVIFDRVDAATSKKK